MGPWREFLKERTQLEHTLTEAVMPVLEPTFDLEVYSKLLLQLQAFYQNFDQAIDWDILKGQDAVLSRRTRKLEWLKEDIDRIGANDRVAVLDFAVRLPKLADEASIFGALYVSEGSTLGGQVITRHLRKNAIFDMHPLKFFGGYSIDTALRWREFLQAAEARVKPSQFDLSAAAANIVFQSLRGHLDFETPEPSPKKTPDASPEERSRPT